MALSGKIRIMPRLLRRPCRRTTKPASKVASSKNRRDRRISSQIGRLFLAGGVLATASVPNSGFAEEQYCISTNATKYVIKTLAIHDHGGTPDIKQLDATISLIGEPDSKSFGVSYQGALTPEGKLAGDEKMVIRLYADCENGAPTDKSMVVSTVQLGSLKKGKENSTLIGTADATALVPLKDVACVRPGID